MHRPAVGRRPHVGVLAVFVALMGVRGGTLTAAASGTGPGTMAVSPGSVTASTAAPLTLQYSTPASNAVSGRVTVLVPAGWTRPQKASTASPGYVAAAPGTCTAAALSAITGTASGPWTVTITVACPAGAGFTLTYGSTTSTVTAPARTGTYTFLTKVAAAPSKLLLAIAVQPVVTVNARPARPVVSGLGPGTGKASGGTPVTISGAHLSGASAVSFGGVAAAFTVTGDTAIHTTAPPGSSAVDVVVTTPGGTSALVAADRFTYTFVQQVGVPAYFPPGAAWSSLLTAHPVVGTAVMNPSSGPGLSQDPGYVTEITAVRAAGVRVLGYVYSSNGNRALADVENDVSSYYSFYGAAGLGGILVDQADASSCTAVQSYYVPLFTFIKQQSPTARVVLNAGTQVPECFMTASDVLIDFEGGYSTYLSGYTAQSWETRYQPGRFWHIIHDAGTPADVQNAVALSRQRGAGLVYVTDEQQSPATATCPGGGTYLYDRLPCNTFWNAELRAVPVTPAVTLTTPHAGVAGTTVTISGSGLWGATAVHFGSLSASSFSVTGPATLTAVAPGGLSGSNDITVTTPAGTTPTGGFDRFTVGPSINVKTDAGAVGDGTTDDSTPFKNALGQLAAAGGGTLVVPAATYAINPGAFVTIPGNVTVLGQGATLVPTVSGYALLGIGAGAGASPDITVEGLTVDGRNLVVRGIEAAPVDDLELTRVTVRNITQPTDSTSPNYLQVPAGIRLEGGGDRITIDQSSVSTVIAINIDPATTHMTAARGIWISPASGQTTSRDITITASSFSEVGPKDDGDCIVAQGGPGDSAADIGLVISGNTFDRCHKRAVKLQLPGATVSGNSIDNPFNGDNPYKTYPPSQDTFDMYSAISVYANDVVLADNDVHGIGSFYNGIELGSGTALSNLIISGGAVSMGSGSRLAGNSLLRDFDVTSNLVVTGMALDYGYWGLQFDGVLSNPLIVPNAISNVTVAQCGPVCP